MRKVIKYVGIDILRSKIVLGYMTALLLCALSIFNLEDNEAKGLLSLLNLLLIVVPLFCIIFSTIYVYSSAEFIELLASQPLKRRQIWLSLYLGLAGSLTIAFAIGVGIPVLLYAPGKTGLSILLMGLLLSVIFAGLALLAAVYSREKSRGIGLAIFLWLYFALLFDSFVLFLLFQFQDYPLENAMLIVSAFNPIDISRIMILLQLDISALMGFTGAAFRSFFGTGWGYLVTLAVLLLWIYIPFWLSMKRFIRKDL